MNELRIDITDENKLSEAAQKLLDFAGANRIFLFEAPMGAGKTTFIKQICRVLGSKDNFSSPTYAIVNEYLAKNAKIYHFDLYRINTEEELMDIGFEEYINSGAYCFIEWPQKAEPFLYNNRLRIVINVNENNRYLSAQILN